MNTIGTISYPNLLKRSALLGIAALTLGLSGCAVYPAGYSYGYTSETIVSGPVVRYAPPPPREEIIGIAPYVGAVWLPGHWVWRDRWVWHRGYWGRPPHRGARWAPGGWDRDDDGWRWHRGDWH